MTSVISVVLIYLFYDMGCVKGKRAFEHAQNAQIQMIMRMRNASSGSLLSIHEFFSIQQFY